MFLGAIFISMAIIPVMIRLAPALDMVDRPDPRKVHALPVARVGGIGIVIGSLVSIALWVPVDHTIAAYLFGSAVLLLFGAWDDCRELGHYVKFIGQFIAAISVVYWGDVWVSAFQFLSTELPESVGKPFTVFAIVGMVNAINHSDGLDGLAAGESLLSLGCIAYLAYRAEGFVLTAMAVAVLGGLFGFLRFNTHPAQVFMGDSGSQFLGFTLGVLAVLLTQQVNRGLSMALPALILGLPIIDILAVFAQRVYHRMNWFRATKNHIHHRLLQLGFHHYQAVVIIYSIQAFFVAGALLLRYESDALVASVYLGVCTLIFTLLTTAEHSGWKVGHHAVRRVTRIVDALKTHQFFVRGPMLVVAVAVPVYFVLSALSIEEVPRDFALAATAFGAVLVFGLIWRRLTLSRYLIRLAVYGMATVLTYLVVSSSQGSSAFVTLEIVFFVGLAAAIAIAVRYGRDIEFRTTTTDYLIIFLVTATALLQPQTLQKYGLGLVVMEVVILLYGSELIVNLRDRRQSALLFVSVLSASIVLISKGLVMV